MPLRTIVLFCLTVATPMVANAIELPIRIAPAAPFPRINLQAPQIETIAPGVSYGEYSLLTSIGPLAVHVVAIAPGRADLRLEAVLAHDALTSGGERLSQMALRTSAVAGINGDYFDIGNTNRPTNLVVQDGRLLKTPRKRYELAIARDGSPSIVEEAFSGQIHLADKTVGLDAINVLPPPGSGVSLITPEFGTVPAAEHLTLVPLTVTNGTPPFAVYRAGDALDDTRIQPAGYYLAIGVNGNGAGAVPTSGQAIAVSGDLAPQPLAEIGTAIGGGPMILQNGQWFNDLDGPSGAEYAQRIPSSGAAIAADGTVFLIEVDGRRPTESVGLERPEFAALMLSLGAVSGMAFDGGGSSALVARTVGEPNATLQSSPSDGVERPIADGIFVYSTAPVGPATRLVSPAGELRMLPGASVPLDVVAIDASEHVVATADPIRMSIEPATLGTLRDGAVIADRPGTGVIHFASGPIAGEIRIEVAQAPARVVLSPTNPNLPAGGRLQLSAFAFDAQGYPLALPSTLAWSASSGAIDDRGAFTAGASDAVVRSSIAGVSTETRVTVGSHELELAFLDRATFSTIPPGGDGSLTHDPTCVSCVQLTFVLGPTERAAYAVSELDLPAGSVGVAFDLRDDGSGARLRLALRNAINEQVLVTATILDHPGWRHVEVRFPFNLAEPASLHAFYVIAPTPEQLLAGSIVIRDLRAIVAGA